MPDRLVHRQTDEPAQEQVVAELLAEPALGGDGMEDLDELGAQQVLGGDSRATVRGIKGLELGAHLFERSVDHGADRAQRVVVRHDVLERGHDDEPRLPLLVSAHAHHLPARLPARHSSRFSGLRGPSCGRLSVSLRRGVFQQPASALAPALGRPYRSRCARSLKLSERLGHATIAITLDTYSRAIPAMQEDAAVLIAGLVFASE